MLIYEYYCDDCKTKIETDKRAKDIKCACGKQAKRIYSVIPVHYHGAGFYTVDKRRDYDYT